ncbi:hypothetical protein AB0P15_01840 [Streptomyces sp. NPDC087917]|uniref:hypothetical protein n=1 Tax=Streptomyces sp. NPDC087917 TaxID=3155060 RepID=UPI003437B378
MGTPSAGGSAGPAPLGRIRSAVRRARAGRRWGLVRDIDLWQRALGFAALGFLTLVPLLIVMSAAGPGGGQGFAHWLGDGLGVSPAARKEIEGLFALPGQAWRSTTALGLAGWSCSAGRWSAGWSTRRCGGARIGGSSDPAREGRPGRGSTSRPLPPRWRPRREGPGGIRQVR